MKRRRYFLLLPCLAMAGAHAGGRETVRGRLLMDPLKPPAVRTEDRGIVTLEGDDPTVAVLRDTRLKDEDFEALGEFTAKDRFRVDPIHERALFVYRGGKRLVITYWCEVCGIRTYSPGKCECCQQETALDPRDPKMSNVE